MLAIFACAAPSALRSPDTFADPADAVRHYEDAVARDPTDPLAHLYLAQAQERRGEAAQAEVHYRKAVELDPDLTQAYLSLGQLLEGSRRFVEAAGVYRQMARDDRTAAAILEKVSMVRDSVARAEDLVREAQGLIDAGHPNAARVLFRRAVSIAPFYLQGRVGLAEALAAKARLSRSYTDRTLLLEESLAEYDQVLREDESFANARDGRDRVASLLDAERRRYSRADGFVAAGLSPFRESLNPELDLPFISFQNRGGGDLTFELSFEEGTEQLSVSVSKANVRDGPGNSYGVLGSLSRGTVVFTLAEEGGFTRVADGNIEGWVASSLLERDVHIVLRLSGHTAREMVVAPGTATCRCSRLGQTIWEGRAEFLPYVSYVWSCE
jgi:Flp pilus assembly protein TadD